jgi:hypothetical protein
MRELGNGNFLRKVRDGAHKKKKLLLKREWKDGAYNKVVTKGGFVDLGYA